MSKGSSASDDGDDEPEDFPSAEVEAAHFKAKYLDIFASLQETKAELDDFQASSKELEDELERELAANEARHEDLTAKNVKLEGEKEEWKSKYLAAQKAHNLALGALQRELDSTKAERDRLKVSLRDLEMGVDDLERNERMVSSSLQDVESRYNRAIEDKTMLEQELIGKQHLEEEAQRLKDEIRDLTTEVSVLREQRPRPPTFPPPPHLSSSLMSPVREDSQELSMSDLVVTGDSSFSSSSFASPSSANPEESPTPYVPRNYSSPTHFSTFGVTLIPNSPNTSRLPLPSSPSQLPRSTTARILNGYTTDGSSVNSSPLAGPSRLTRATPSTGGRSVSTSSAGKSTGTARMAGALREQAAKIGNRIPSVGRKPSSSSVPHSTKPLPGTAGAVAPPRGVLAKSRTNVLATAAPRTPGTPGTADWVMVSEGENSPTPGTALPGLENGMRGGGGGAMRMSTTQAFSLGAKPKSSSTTSALPTRNAIPSPLGATYNSQTLPSSRARPSSRMSNLSSSLHSSRPTTPTYLPVRSPSSSHIPRPSSPAPGVPFPSSSSASGSNTSRPRVLGTSTSSSKHPPPNPSSYSSSGDGSLRRSIRRISLDQSAQLPTQHASATRPGGPRTSFSSSSTNSRPQSVPVPPRNPPPVPPIPSNYASRRQGVVGIPLSSGTTSRQEGLGNGLPEREPIGRGAQRVLARKRSMTGGTGLGGDRF